MSNLYSQLYAGLEKTAVAALTPEAMQAVQAPMAPQGGAPMDPAAMGGAPMGAPAAPPMGGAPMDPAAMGGAMPPDAAGAGVPVGPAGGTVPPEILQDQEFLMFLQQMMGIIFDPQSQMFMDQQGQPIPAEMIIQAYQEFRTQMDAQSQGGMPQGGAPMDPAAMGGAMPPEGAPMDPSALGGAMPPEAAAALPPGGAPMDPAAMGGAMPPEGAPMDPSAMGGAMPPEAAAAMPPGGAPMDPAAMGGAMPPEGAPMDPAAGDPMTQMAEMVLSAVETMLNESLSAQEKKISTILDKLDTLKKDIDSLLNTDNRRTEKDEDEDASLRNELDQELAASSGAQVPVASPIPVAEAIPKAAADSGLKASSGFSLFNLVTGKAK